MKILFVTDLCPIKEDEFGLPLVLLNFIEDFKLLGCDVTLLRPNVIPNILIRGRKILPEGNYNYKGINIINKNFLTPNFNKKNFYFLKNNNYDIVISHMPSGIMAAHTISKMLNIPYTVSVHSSDIKVLTDFKYSFLKSKMKKAYVDANMVFPRSFWLKNIIEEIIPEIGNKTHVLPSGIDKEILIDEENMDEKIKNFYANPYKIFSAGSLIKRKNFENLIKTVAKIDGATLDIAGEGKEKIKLQKLIKKLHAEDRIKLLGQKTKNEIYELMEKYPVFALLSKNETFGMVYLEALSKGSIVICTENSGMAGFIEDGKNGFLVSESSSLSKIKNLINVKNADAIMKNARETAQNLEKIKMAQNYLNLIQNILV